MGQQGEDVILSPAFRKVLDLDIECKNVERLDVAKTFWEHFNKYINRPSLKVLTHTKNRSLPLVTIRLADFLYLIKRTLPNVK
jgi:hypothetical protein